MTETGFVFILIYFIGANFKFGEVKASKCPLLIIFNITIMVSGDEVYLGYC